MMDFDDAVESIGQALERLPRKERHAQMDAFTALAWLSGREQGRDEKENPRLVYVPNHGSPAPTTLPEEPPA